MTLVSMELIGLGIGALLPNLYSFAAQISTESDRGRNMGVVQGVTIVGPFVAQLGIDPVARLTGPEGALIALGLLGLLAAPLVKAIAQAHLPELGAVKSARHG